MRGQPTATAVRTRFDWRYPGDLRRTQGIVIVALGVPVAVLVGMHYPAPALLRFLIGYGAAVAAQIMFIGAMARRIGQERSSIADLLTLCRAGGASLLAGLVASGLHDRAGLAGILGLAIAVVCMSVSDWLDGPLARMLGPTQLGAVLDIEADSWLTLWSAAAVIAWGGLPVLVLVPPMLHYVHPVLALRAGKLPAGGGPWWTRVTGSAQMLLFALALLPWQGATRDLSMIWLAYPISIAQIVTMLFTLPCHHSPQP